MVSIVYVGKVVRRARMTVKSVIGYAGLELRNKVLPLCFGVLARNDLAAIFRMD